MDRFFTLIATHVSRAVGQPFAFVAAMGIICVWGVTGPVFGYSDTWQLVINTGTTIITFLMVFVIQNSQNRDAAAMQAKLDELIRTQQDARNSFIGIEHLTEVQIEKIRAALESEGEAQEEARLERHESVDRFLKRL
ncbi:low affinity iron permease family protein [Blastomonas fulva]|uniref:low affinity iron permease family protein n=1 Tax=Blastomonas fulva TaxID=1550728 RepID=UPI003F71851F